MCRFKEFLMIVNINIEMLNFTLIVYELNSMVKWNLKKLFKPKINLIVKSTSGVA